MAWNKILEQPITAVGPDLTVFDSRALLAGNYPTSLSWAMGCGGVIQAIIVALRGAPSLVQKFSNTSGTISATTWTIAYPANNTAGNCLILDISYSAGSFTAGPTSVTDTQGNTWTKVSSGNPAFQPDFLETWVCQPCASGANTVTVHMGGSFPITSISAAILEYRGSTGTVDGQQYGTGTTFGVGSPINISATANAGDLLHLVTSNTDTCVASPPTGGGADSCFPAWLVINEPASLVGGHYFPPLTQRVFAHNFDGVWTWDGIAKLPGPQAAGISQAYTGVQDMLGGAITLRGSGITFVQGDGSASAANVDVGTFTQAFGSNNAAGNCIVVDVFGLLDVPDTFAISDSQGNTYTQVYFRNTGAFGGGDCWSTFVALNCAAGANTVTITVNGIGSNKAEDWAIAIHEYSGVLASGAVDSSATADVLAQTNSSAIQMNLSTGGSSELLHVAVFTHQYNTGTVNTLASSGAGGWVDQSERIFFGDKLGFSSIVRQRGQATVPLIVHASDSYTPTVGSQVCLWDLTATEDLEVFSGTIQDIDWRWLDQTGYRVFTLTCVSLDAVFDTIRLPNLLFEDMTAGDIFTALFAYAAGSPIALGTVSAGVTIANFLVSDYPSIAEMFTRLATLAGFIWGVDPGTGTLYFHLPNTTPAPFTLTSDLVLWLSFTLKQERQDYRNRQILKVPDSVAVQSSEYFVGAGQLSFTLLRPVQSVTAAWITQNTQNAATGTLSGLPNIGDTVSFTFPTAGSGFNWAASSPYSVDQIIIDPSGFIQRCVIAGTSGGSQPSWIDVYGQTTTDNTVGWKNEGPAGFGNGVIATYTFVDVLDNTQFGQVLRGGSVAAAIQNLADAINAIAAQAGVTFSLPTWENPQVNADEPAGASTVVVRNKAAGAGFSVSLSKTGTAFSWSSSTTTGGVTTFGTITVNVGVQGQTAGGTGPTLVYTPGSNVVSLATPLNSGSNLQVQYVGSGANYIQVENTADVILRAEIEQSTGKYQQSSSDDQAITLPAALLLAQQQLAAYGVIPSTFQFETFQAGLYVGQVITLDMLLPTGIGATVNANWFIQEIRGEAMMVQDLPGSGVRFLPGPNGGHYKYTVTVIDVAQIGSWIDFWLGMTGGSSSSGALATPGGGSLGPSTGGGSGYTQGFAAVAGTPLAITHGLNTTAVIAMAYDSSGNQMLFSALTVTDANTVTVTFGISFSGTIAIVGVA